jgi:hypothetical protein
MFLYHLDGMLHKRRQARVPDDHNDSDNSCSSDKSDDQTRDTSDAHARRRPIPSAPAQEKYGTAHLKAKKAARDGGAFQLLPSDIYPHTLQSIVLVIVKPVPVRVRSTETNGNRSVSPSGANNDSGTGSVNHSPSEKSITAEVIEAASKSSGVILLIHPLCYLC